MSQPIGFHSGVAIRTIFGEARGEPELGKLAVAHVIRNRIASQRWGRTAAAVCLSPYQFSAWNTKDPNRKLLLELMDSDPALAECEKAWRDSQFTDDPTKGAMHYRVVGTPAKWAEDQTPCATIGHHEFFAGIK